MHRVWRICVIASAVTWLAAPAIAQPSGDSGIGYPSPAAALEALRNKPGVSVTTQSGWTIAEDSAANTIWSFTPAGHAAHPAVVKRSVVPQGGELNMQMSVLCGGPKPACDQLVAEFQALNERMRQSLPGNRP